MATGMKRWWSLIKRNFIVAAIITLIFLFAGCNTSTSIDNSDLDKYDVSKTKEEIVQDDFIFRLVSEKEEYRVGEDVKLYGEIVYVGQKDEVTINHSSSAILFPIEEKIRVYNISYLVNDIGLSTTLKQGEPYREEYVKSGGYSPDQDPDDYVNFIQGFIKKDGFPAGYYVVSGYTDFSVGSSENTEEHKRLKIEAKIDFKVLE